MTHLTTCLALLLSLAPGCALDTDPVDEPPGDGDGGDGPGDDPGGGGGGGGGGGDLEPPATGFQIRTPDITIGAGVEVTYCYYTTISNAQAAGVRRWESSMTPGSHHMILYLVDELPQPEGTIDDSGECGLLSGDLGAIWSYAAQEPEADFTLPDGVGMSVGADQKVVMQMHYLNATDQALDAHVTINGHTYEAGAPYEEIHAYVTYDDQIEIGPAQEGSAGGSCAVPEDARFIVMSTHSHRFTTRAQVLDGDQMLVDTDDWDHPALSSWPDAPFYQFTGNLNYRCEYFNDSNAPVLDGDSAETDEMCMAVGYFIGGDGPIGCLNSLAVPL